MEVKKLKDELAEKDKGLSHANKVYDGLLHQHEDLKAENERLKANRASKKAEARMNDVAVEELEKVKEDQARSIFVSKANSPFICRLALAQLEEARQTQAKTRADFTRKLQDVEGAHQGKFCWL